MSIHTYVYPGPSEVSAACAARILALLKDTLEHRESACLAVSGGSTPKLMFADFVKAQMDWSRVHLFWVDERGVPPTDSQSNYKMTKEAFLDPARFPESNVHRIRTELPAEEAARLYADELRDFFGLAAGALPRFDVVHQGMGPDGHTASLFPGEPRIDDRENLAAALYVEKMKQWRVTLLPGVLLAARTTVALIAGADKAEPLRAVLDGTYDPKKYPMQLVTRSQNQVLWFLDRPAASRLG